MMPRVKSSFLRRSGVLKACMNALSTRSPVASGDDLTAAVRAHDGPVPGQHREPPYRLHHPLRPIVAPL